MEIIFNKPYLISWLAIPLLIVISFLSSRPTLDIQLYDTYYVIANRHYVTVGSAFLLVIGMGYWLIYLSGKTPNTILTGIHLFLTIGVLILFTLPFNKTTLADAEWLLLCSIAFTAGQFAYVVNSLLTLLRK